MHTELVATIVPLDIQLLLGNDDEFDSYGVALLNIFQLLRKQDSGILLLRKQNIPGRSSAIYARPSRKSRKSVEYFIARLVEVSTASLLGAKAGT